MPAWAEWGEFEYDFDANKKPWKEVEALIPAFPEDAGLKAFVVSATSPHRHYIDYPSVSVGEDAVVRYTVVVRTAGGAEHVNFEGMRCATGEYKIYAFGRRNVQGKGEWTRNKYSRWSIIQDRAADSYHRELFYSYFCAGGFGDPSLERVQRWLKSGGYKPE
jgi:hypothetical protein